jgi:hypothetical protein
MKSKQHETAKRRLVIKTGKTIILFAALLCCNCEYTVLSYLSSHLLLPDQPVVPNRSDKDKSVVSMNFKATNNGETPHNENIYYNLPLCQLGVMYDYDFRKNWFASINAYSYLKQDLFLASSNIQFGYRHIFEQLGMRANVSIGFSKQNYYASVIHTIDNGTVSQSDTLNMSGKPINLTFGGSFLVNTIMEKWPIQIGLAINMNHVNCFYYENASDTLTANLNSFAVKPFVEVDIAKSLYMILSIDNHFVNISTGIFDFMFFNHYVPYFELSVLKEF